MLSALQINARIIWRTKGKGDKKLQLIAFIETKPILLRKKNLKVVLILHFRENKHVVLYLEKHRSNYSTR